MYEAQYLPTAITTAQRLFYHEHGYVVVHNVALVNALAQLRRDCDTLFNECEQDLVNELGCVLEPLSTGEDKLLNTSFEYYTKRRSELTVASDRVLHLVLNPIADLAQCVLPSTPSGQLHLYNEQYIIKPPYFGTKTSFRWHQDSEYAPTSVVPTVACWVALDDISHANGAVIVEPYPPAEDTVAIPSDIPSYNNIHTAAASKYGSEPVCEVVVEIPAGSILLMSGYLRHCSAANSTAQFRRAFMPQYSLGPVVAQDTGALVARAIPLTR